MGVEQSCAAVIADRRAHQDEDRDDDHQQEDGSHQMSRSPTPQCSSLEREALIMDVLRRYS